MIELTCGETTKHAVSVRTDLTDGLPLIEGDPVQMQQVALNLVINAVEAMSETSQGARELLVGTGRTETGDVRVTVRDSGRVSTRSVRTGCSKPSTRPSRAGRESAWRSAGRLSRRMAAGCGSRRTSRREPSFSSRCPPWRAALRSWDHRINYSPAGRMAAHLDYVQREMLAVWD